MRRNVGQASEIRTMLLFVASFAPHYFPAILCGHLTSRGVIDVDVTPHSFRHATAVHLVSPGVDITVIRSWLGHASLDTTNHYAKANLETKRKALELVDAPTTEGHRPSWKRDASLLAWRDTL